MEQTASSYNRQSTNERALKQLIVGNLSVHLCFFCLGSVPRGQRRTYCTMPRNMYILPMTLKFIASEHKMTHDNRVWDLRKRVHDSNITPRDWSRQMDYLDELCDKMDCEITIEDCIRCGL